MKTPGRVAIVGRPNVGKSTLFNRIVRKRQALVHPTPGVTRDVQYHETDWNGVPFEIVDTGGIFTGVDDELIQHVEDRALREAMGADAMIFVTDAETGVTAADIDVAARLREANIPVFLSVNKTEKAQNRHGEAEFFQLGFDNIYPISALHGEGLGDLLDDVVAVLPRRQPGTGEQELKVAIVGKPNVGKSSMVNRLVGEEANIVDSRPGTTRDSIDLSVRWESHQITLVDTAGIKRRSQTKDAISTLSTLKSMEAITRADIVVMMLDATEVISNQDVRVASYAHKAGKGLMIVVNKWDLVEKDNRTTIDFEKEIRRSFAFATYAPVLYASALTAQRASRIFPMAWEIKESREKRVNTSELNQFIEEITREKPPPIFGGGNGRIFYGSQVEVAPPTFSLFVNKRAYFGRNYIRFLSNRFRERYGFEGTMIRIKLVNRR